MPQRSLILLRTNFALHLPCCALIFLYAYPAVALFVYALLLCISAVLLFFCTLTLLYLPCCAVIFLRGYSAVLTLLCSYFSAHLLRTPYPTALTLLRSYFSSHLPCCALTFLRNLQRIKKRGQSRVSDKQDNGTAGSVHEKKN